MHDHYDKFYVIFYLIQKKYVYISKKQLPQMEGGKEKERKVRQNEIEKEKL